MSKVAKIKEASYQQESAFKDEYAIVINVKINKEKVKFQSHFYVLWIQYRHFFCFFIHLFIIER